MFFEKNEIFNKLPIPILYYNKIYPYSSILSNTIICINDINSRVFWKHGNLSIIDYSEKNNKTTYDESTLNIQNNDFEIIENYHIKKDFLEKNIDTNIPETEIIINSLENYNIFINKMTQSMCIPDNININDGAFILAALRIILKCKVYYFHTITKNIQNREQIFKNWCSMIEQISFLIVNNSNSNIIKLTNKILQNKNFYIKKNKINNNMIPMEYEE